MAANSSGHRSQMKKEVSLPCISSGQRDFVLVKSSPRKQEAAKAKSVLNLH